jgi:hypothetical protein
MTLEHIKDQIRSLESREKIELYRWLDRGLAVDFCSDNFCSRIGVSRFREIKQAIEQMSKSIESPKMECDSRVTETSSR